MAIADGGLNDELGLQCLQVEKDREDSESKSLEFKKNGKEIVTENEESNGEATKCGLRLEV